jgi:hypothetical protein
MRDRLRQRAIASLLRTHDGPPSILATQIFFLFDEKPFLAGFTDNMTSEMVVLEVGNILRSRQRLHEEVDVWARDLFKQAGLPFDVPSTSGDMENADPPSGLSVVLSKPAASKTIAQSQPKRKSRRVYLDLAIQCLEKGSCTHRGLVDSIMKQFPDLNRETVSTFVSDVQNPRYSPIKDRKVVKQADGTLVFEDKIKSALTVIENPNFAEKADVEPVTVPAINNARE